MKLRNVRFPVVVALVCVVAAVLMTVSPVGCVSDEPRSVVRPPAPPAKLVVITPHSSMIRELFQTGFSDWHHKHHRRFVEIQWIPMGTVECLEYINDIARKPYDAGGRLIPDVMFGGGITDHKTLLEHGQAKAVKVTDALEGIPETILGLPTRDREGYWHSTALSGFGIFYHKKACLQRGVPEPTTWTDLAKPEYYGWVSLADPNRSGSNRECLTLIVQKYGWSEGWPIILRIAANSRALLRSSRDVIGDVRAGVSLAGPSVSFTAMHEIEMVGANELAYANPPGASAITPDVVTVLSSAAMPELAARFVRFCLSEQGQVLWSVKAQERQGYRNTLYRYPLLAQMYEDYGDKLALAGNPLSMETELRLDLDQATKQSRIIAPLLRAACGDNHIQLQRCWRRIIDAGIPDEALTALGTLPFDEQQAYEFGATCHEGGPEADALVAEWSKLFGAKYDEILSMLK